MLTLAHAQPADHSTQTDPGSAIDVLYQKFLRSLSFLSELSKLFELSFFVTEVPTS